jgi:ribonuclease-3
MTLNKLLEKLELSFQNQALIERVFIHRSFLNETTDKSLESNERLEFLGDAVLELVVTEYLYEISQEPEGVLTGWRAALVKGEMISQVADRLGLFDCLQLSRGEQAVSGKAKGLILANTFEALLGAIYLESGYDRAKQFIHTHLLPHLEDILADESHIDPKSKLQEITQRTRGTTPRYEVTETTGPDHDKSFVVAVFAGSTKLAEGSGTSKQRAEMAAARAALEVTE